MSRPANFRSSKNKKRTSSVLNERSQVQSAQWIRSIRANFIRPRSITNKKAKLLHITLIEFDSPGKLITIVFSCN